MEPHTSVNPLPAFPHSARAQNTQRHTQWHLCTSPHTMSTCGHHTGEVETDSAVPLPKIRRAEYIFGGGRGDAQAEEKMRPNDQRLNRLSGPDSENRFYFTDTQGDAGSLTC